MGAIWNNNATEQTDSNTNRWQRVGALFNKNVARGAAFCSRHFQGNRTVTLQKWGRREAVWM